MRLGKTIIFWAKGPCESSFIFMGHCCWALHSTPKTTWEQLSESHNLRLKWSTKLFLKMFANFGCTSHFCLPFSRLPPSHRIGVRFGEARIENEALDILDDFFPFYAFFFCGRRKMKSSAEILTVGWHPQIEAKPPLLILNRQRDSAIFVQCNPSRTIPNTIPFEFGVIVTYSPSVIKHKVASFPTRVPQSSFSKHPFLHHILNSAIYSKNWAAGPSRRRGRTALTAHNQSAQQLPDVHVLAHYTIRV
mmetsp:Transcript_59390/g.158021  ORF Transcript_59390/g.158021 Transcript_59390/m.158021 type:complete len:248 (+) Transcript_59390:485-1228(+)